MKHRIFFILITLILSIPLYAQKGLHIAPFFNGQFHNRNDATEILLKGHKLEPYRLSLFRSITLSAAAPEVRTIEQAVLADGATAIDKEMSYSGANKHLYYGFYQLKRSGSVRRYLFFRNNSLNPPHSRKHTVTLIYMEGTASIEDLKRNFGK